MASELDATLEFEAADGAEKVLHEIAAGEGKDADDLVDAVKYTVDRIHEDDREDAELPMLIDDGRFSGQGTSNFGLNDNSSPEIKAA